MVINKNTFNDTELNNIRNLAKTFNLLEDTVKIIYSRGYKTEEEISRFLNPSVNNFNDAFLLSGIKEGIERINRAKQNNETVLIYGDYDADGIMATTILYRSLKLFGINAVTFVPERENGYGLQEEVLEELVSSVLPDLIITVDCGISCYKEVEYLKDLGVDVIITDHHEIPDVIPDTTVINCKLKNQEYPFDCLSGAGVAYKLSYALIGDMANKFLDLVAIATIADSMALVGENRDIVEAGLKLIKNGNTLEQVNVLLNVSSVKEITALNVAFSVAPKINAAGRMGDANLALTYFLSDDIKVINELVKSLITYNIDRQTECDNMYKKAKSSLKYEQIEGALITYDKEYKNGLVGILTAKLSEEYYLPAVTFSGDGEVVHGSARSIEGVNIYEAIASAKDLLVDFGGHSQAAGLSIKKENLNAFKKRLSEYICNTYKKDTFVKKIEVDDIVTSFSPRRHKELTLLEPFGSGNKKPLFAINIQEVNASRLKPDSNHVSFNFKGIDFVYFSGVKDLNVLQASTCKHVVFESNISLWNGKEYFKGQVKQVETENVLTSGYEFYSLLRAFSVANGSNYNGYSVISVSKAKELLNSVNPLGFNTLFVLNNPKNIELYPEISNFKQEILSLKDTVGKNAVLIGGLDGEEDYSNYSRIIHLDKPIKVEKYINFKSVEVVEEVVAFNACQIKTDRAFLGEIFKNICSLYAENFINYYQLYENLRYDIIDFAFAISVFKELGFLSLNKNITINRSEKKELSSSTIYEYISNL